MLKSLTMQVACSLVGDLQQEWEGAVAVTITWGMMYSLPASVRPMWYLKLGGTGQGLCIALPQTPWAATSSVNVPSIRGGTGAWMLSPSQLCASAFKGKFCPLSSDWVCPMSENRPLLFLHKGASSMTAGVCNREWEYKIWDWSF